VIFPDQSDPDIEIDATDELEGCNSANTPIQCRWHYLPNECSGLFLADPLLAVPTAGLGVAGVAGAQPSILFRCVLLFALGDGWLIFALSFM
jgi:hypothetical protein